MSKIFFILFFLAGFLYGGIINIMAEFTWGNLPKNQIDGQLITEAIAEAIEAHEADPEAHLGSGESLEQHKSNDVIDHPAFSILPDKFFGGDIVIKTQFENLDPWTQVGSVSTADWNGLALYTEWGDVNSSYVSSSMYANGQMFDQAKDMYFETQGKFDMSNSHYNAWLGFISDYGSTNVGFGFQVRDGALYAHVRRGSTTDDDLISGITLSDSHVYSAFYDQSAGTVSFKIDGVEVALITVPSGTNWDDDRVPFFGLTLTQSNDGNAYFSYLYAWRKVLTA